LPISDQYIADVDIDTEENETLVAQKINSEIGQSRSYWEAFKNLCTDLYFDFLAYKEAIRDKTKSNTFIPLSYVDIMVTKARIKEIITSAKPFCRVLPKPYNPELSFKLGHFAHELLVEAEVESFLDILIQDAQIYPGAPFQVTWGIEHKELPAFHEMQFSPQFPPIRIPKFDEFTQERVFEDQETREGIFLENIKIDDFHLPRKSKKVETDPWAAKTYSKSLTELEAEIDPVTGLPRYQNLDRLRRIGETRRADSSEQARQGQPLKRDLPGADTFVPIPDITEFCTGKSIFHVPEGTDFLILKERNGYRRKPYHIARVEQLNNEPFGFCPNRANHQMSRTYNEIVDVVMDGLFLEDNKAWILNEDLVDDFEVGATQNNLIHVKGLDGGVDVATAIKAIETRAIAPEILPLLQIFDRLHQLVAGRPDTAAGIPAVGAETAYENALLERGSSGRILDMTTNLVNTALRPIYEDLFHLAKIYFATQKSIEILDDKGDLINQLTVGPGEVFGDIKFSFEFLGKERRKIEQRAAMINLLQVWGNMVNIDPVSVLIMKNLLIDSGIPDTAAIQEALDASIQQRMQIQQMQMQIAMQKANQPSKGGDKQGSVHQSMNTAANAGDTFKPVGM